MKAFKRKLADGRDVDVGRNHGLRKMCDCPRRQQAKCNHSWYFNFSWQGRPYRFSIDRQVGRRVESRTEAEDIADQIRAAIRAGRFEAGNRSPAVGGADSSR
jgi:hypothetical protein